MVGQYGLNIFHLDPLVMGPYILRLHDRIETVELTCLSRWSPSEIKTRPRTCLRRAIRAVSLRMLYAQYISSIPIL